MTKKKLYYHLYCTENISAWTNVFFEQMNYIQYSGLMKELESISLTALVYDDDQFDQLLSILKTYPVNIDAEKVFNPFKDDKEMIFQLYTDKGIHEDYTHHKIYEDCFSTNENYLVCYVQSKGVIQYYKNNIFELKKYYHWRNYLNWGNIENWKICTDALQFNDVSGVDYQTDPIPHFRGTMWWSKTQHIRTLPDPSTDAWWTSLKVLSNNEWMRTCPPRFKAEFWVTNKPGVKVYNYHDPEENPAAVVYERHKYKSI